MRCPFCGYTESKVIDSRPIDESERIRRRRECLKCERRFTTYEVVESTPLVVIKRDQSREPFDGNKLLAGMLRACEKRPVPLSVLEEAVRQIEMSLQNSLDKEVASSRIGELAFCVGLPAVPRHRIVRAGIENVAVQTKRAGGSQRLTA